MTTHSLDAPDVLTDGEWRVDRGVQRWFPAPRVLGKGGRPRKPYTMHPDTARFMHSRYQAGERGAEVRRGHAEYQRRWLREKRAA